MLFFIFSLFVFIRQHQPDSTNSESRKDFWHSKTVNTGSLQANSCREHQWVQKAISSCQAYTNYFHSKHDFKFDMIDEIDQQGNVSFKDLSTVKIDFSHITFGLGLTALLW